MYDLPAYALYVDVGELVGLGTIYFCLYFSVGYTMLAREIKRPVNRPRMRGRLLHTTNHPISALSIVIIWLDREVGHSGKK